VTSFSRGYPEYSTRSRVTPAWMVLVCGGALPHLHVRLGTA
jgi:hypothetical protein